ncbi:MAG TPA: PepSY-like domain-containing protein [Chitinophagaceae bacterium]
MKSVTLFVTATMFSFFSCSQDIPGSKVPSVVLNTVEAKFGTSPKIEWEKKNTLYEAEFKKDSTEYTVYIDSAGKLVMYKLDIKESELPAAVSTIISTEYIGYKVDDSEKVEKDGTTYYQVELEGKGKKDMELVFSADGRLATQMNYLK